jgi:repressor LexA
VSAQHKGLGLTPRQRLCLDAIRAHHGATRAMPSIAELQTALGKPSKTAVHRLLVQLEKRGAIRRKRGQARAIRVIDNSCPHCGGEL